MVNSIEGQEIPPWLAESVTKVNIQFARIRKSLEPIKKIQKDLESMEKNAAKMEATLTKLDTAFQSMKPMLKGTLSHLRNMRRNSKEIQEITTRH